MKQRQLRGLVQHVFDGLCSRYSDFDGWSLWGCVRRFAPALSVRFLPRDDHDDDDDSDDDDPLRRAVIRTCRARFEAQGRLRALLDHELQRATVAVAEASTGVILTIEIVLVDGRTVAGSRFVEVRPHDPRREHRSTRREPVTA